MVFISPNPSSRTMSLGLTQPLAKIRTTNHPGGEARPERKADNLSNPLADCLENVASSTSHNPAAFHAVTEKASLNNANGCPQVFLTAGTNNFMFFKHSVTANDVATWLIPFNLVMVPKHSPETSVPTRDTSSHPRRQHSSWSPLHTHSTSISYLTQERQM
jgi:hypothetical protein